MTEGAHKMLLRLIESEILCSITGLPWEVFNAAHNAITVIMRSACTWSHLLDTCFVQYSPKTIHTYFAHSFWADIFQKVPSMLLRLQHSTWS